MDLAYLNFFACFNEGRFFEAHEVLEKIWLPERGSPRADFYRALIQLAAAFHHLQSNRIPPAIALFRSAASYLQKYPSVYEGWRVTDGVMLIHQWMTELMKHPNVNPLQHRSAPHLELIPDFIER